MTQKEQETKKFVDKYMNLHWYSPSYREVAKHFDIYPSVAWSRCKKFRHLMWAELDLPKLTKVKEVFLIPNEKLEEFGRLRNMIYDLLK